ncbi:MAG: cold shock domain-containing protein [Pseudomonadales bacterium]|nr:cold shock domain-containing protein [Pseudomonadales bacterium]
MSRPGAASKRPADSASAKKPPRETAAAAGREQGQVKWFNVSKGFGFITKDDGEEIFVHFRSIRGGGRRGLRDGQRVTFVVAQSDKGPQAEDVEGID